MIERRCLRPLCGCVLVLALLAGNSQSANSQAVPENPARNAGAGRDIRDKVRAGKLHSCISDSQPDTSSQPVLVFINNCDRQANLMLCVRFEAAPKAYYLILIGANGEARQRFWDANGRSFQYKFNSCDRPYCTPPKPEC
jgi:hypothetical protein